MVAVPLCGRRRVIGLLEAFSAEPFGFNDSDMGSLELLAELILAALKPEDEDRFAASAQAGIFTIRNIPQHEIEPVLAVACPNILFPYVREVISETTSRAGFPPVILAPVNFEAIYAQQRGQAAGSQDSVQIITPGVSH